MIKSMDDLKQAVASDPDLSGIATKLRTEVEAIKQFFARYDDVLGNHLTPEEAENDQVRWKRLDSAENELMPLCNTLVQTLTEIANSETSVRNLQLEAESKSRLFFNAIALIAALLGVAASVLVAFSCVKDLRIAVDALMVNADKMANREKLLPIIEGNRELTQLDIVFHDVDRAIDDSLKSERAVFENAADLVCSIDRRGVFQYANPSVVRLLGYSQREVKAKSFLDIVAPADCARADDEFNVAARLAEPRNFELKLRRADKQEFDSDWSVFWSAIDGSLFCVVSDITERKNAERLRHDFITMIKDDISGPLTAIAEAIAEVLDKSPVREPEAVQTELTACKTTADRLIQLINDLLRFEKLQTDMMEFKLAPVLVSSLIERSIREVQTLAAASNVNLRFKELRCRVMADEHRLMQLLINLLSNAIRYSPDGGTVAVELKEDNGFLEIAVCDDGPGVPEEAKEKIFLPFEQAPGSKVTASGGTGLGLAIAKLIVDGHHGDIGVRDGQNGGSIFWFTVPMVAPG